jgi:hypothetical protein
MTNPCDLWESVGTAIADIITSLYSKQEYNVEY